MPAISGFHMSSDEFRSHGYAMIDWIANYYDQIEQYPVLSQVLPGEIRAALPELPPQKHQPFEDILADVE